MERTQLAEAHSHAGDGRRRDLSEHGKKPTDRSALTAWRRQREGLVRTRKETDQPRHTHILETAVEETCQNTERNRPTEAHSHPGDGRGRDLSGNRKKPAEQGTLTNWRWQREGPGQDTERNRLTKAHSLPGDGGGRVVRTQKETDRPRHTHILEMAEG